MDIEDIYPLTFQQQGLLFHALASPREPLYVDTNCMELRGAVDASLFEESWRRVIADYAVLRTALVWEGLKEPLQVVKKSVQPVLTIEDWRQFPEGSRAGRLASALEAMRSRPFDLAAAPLMRLALIRIEDERYIFAWCRHHLVLDGWSSAIVIHRVLRIYEALRSGEQPPADGARRYADYTAWLRAQDMQAAERLWRAELHGCTTPTPLNIARAASADAAGEWVHEVSWSPDATKDLEAFARACRVTLSTLFQGAWALLLAQYSNQPDVLFGSGVSGRGSPFEGVQNMVGLFVNTLPVRIRVRDESELGAWLRDIQARQMQLREYEFVPLRLIQQWTGSRGGELFHTILVSDIDNPRVLGLETRAEGALEIQHLSLHRSQTNYPMNASAGLVHAGSGAQLLLRVALRRDHYDESMASRVLGHFQTLLESMLAAGADAKVKQICALSRRERQRVLRDWNDAHVAYESGGRCLHEEFEEQVRKTPDAVAVVYEGRTLSYAQLNARANQLAHYLRARGVGPEQLVGVCVERSLEMMIGLLGVLKAGAAYVPLDPTYPADRLHYMLEDTAAPILLTVAKVAESLPASAAQTVLLDEHWDAITNEAPTNLLPSETGVRPAHLAYVIYTSGSTGNPKGVMVEHRGLLNYLEFARREYLEAGEDGGALVASAFTFDATATSLYTPLLRGRRVHLIREGDEIDGLARECAGEHCWDLVKISPAHLQALGQLWKDRNLGDCAVRTFVIGGEALPPSTVRLWQSIAARIRLINEYGPTETVVGCSVYEVSPHWDAAATVPIGRPIPNTQMYVLDRNQQPVPIGVAGEIYIAGAGVARGYLNRAELTAERFVRNPFGGDPTGRMYRSGDLGRWRADGILEYLGRNDDQVKVRGYRVELGEIQAHLCRCAGVRDAVVVAREEGAQKQLIAYFTAATDAPSVTELRAQLSARLPQYMVPSALVRLDTLPLTPNGKVDRKELPEPGRLAQAVPEYEPPEGAIEETLAAIWQELLPVGPVGRRDNFFELGGHSLLAIQLVSRIREVLGREIALADLFAHSSLRLLADHVGQATSRAAPPIASVVRNERMPLSFAQQQLWFLAQMGQSESYHTSLHLRLIGELNTHALRRALHRIVERHEALRTRFVSVEGVAEQRIVSAEDRSFGWHEYDFRSAEEPESERQRLMREALQRPFDLERGPLMQVRVVREAEHEHTLLITMHHLVSDGWSIGVLLSELSALYGAYVKGEADPLPTLPVQYVDYALWQRRWMSTQVQHEQAQYWKKTLEGAPALLELPWDHARPAQQASVGDVVEVVLDRQLTRELKELSQRHGTTLFMTMLASWALLLGRLSGQSEVVVGTTTANRHRRELESLIGLFVNTLAIRVDVSGSPPVAELLRRVKEQTLQAQQHQDIPFDQVVELVKPVRTLAHSPIFQTVLTWQNAPITPPVLEGLQIASISGLPQVTAKFDLSPTLGEWDGEIRGNLEYATALFERETIERYLGHWRHLLEQMARSDDVGLDRLALLRAEERKQLLRRWNETRVLDENEGKCLHEVFEEQVRRTPDALAVAYEGDQLSYAQLNARANQLAHYLNSRGIGPDQLVGVCVERSLEMVIALLGVLKAGGVYVPLDPRYPPDRLQYMLEDTAAPILLTMTDAAEKLPASIAQTILLDVDWDIIAKEPATDLPVSRTGVRPANLAYVIYTSGSTGRPKGVMVEHRGSVNLAAAQVRAFKVDASSRILQFASLSFDGSLWECVMALCAGASLHLASRDSLVVGPPLLRTLRSRQISHATLVPTVLSALSPEESLESLQTLIVAGEACPQTLVQRWAPGRQLINAYGPTETTVCASTYRCDANEQRDPPIGGPIANAQIYILDRNAEPVPVGVVGEIHVAGAQLARGYLNRPALTAARFVPNPFGPPGSRLYCTGDLGRWCADGQIEYRGRNDQQVKIRGFRVERGEIEARLREHPGVRDAAVLVEERRPGEKQLIAYYVLDDAHAQPDTSVDAAALRTWLARQVPDHMLPASFVGLDELPFTAHGKLDHRALAALAAEQGDSGPHEPPDGEIEAQLAELWKELLSITRVGRHDSFFDLGGHSLLAVRLVTRIQDEFGVEIPLAQVFLSPSLLKLADVIVDAQLAQFDVQDIAGIAAHVHGAESHRVE